MKFAKVFATAATIASVALMGSFEPAKAQESDLNSANNANSSAAIYFGGEDSSGGGILNFMNMLGGAIVPSSPVYPGDTAVTQMNCAAGNKITLRRATEENSISLPFVSISSSEVEALAPEQIASVVKCLGWSDPSALATFANASNDRIYILAANALAWVMATSGELDVNEVQRYRKLIQLRLPEGSEPNQEMVDLAEELFVKKWALTAAQNRNN